MVGLLAMDHNSASLTEVARNFRRDVTTNNGVRQLRERSNKDKQFRQQVTRVEKRLVQIKTSDSAEKPPIFSFVSLVLGVGG